MISEKTQHPKSSSHMRQLCIKPTGFLVKNLIKAYTTFSGKLYLTQHDKQCVSLQHTWIFYIWYKLQFSNGKTLNFPHDDRCIIAG